MRIERGMRVEHALTGGRIRGTVIRVTADVRVDGVRVDHHTYDVCNLLPEGYTSRPFELRQPTPFVPAAEPHPDICIYCRCFRSDAATAECTYGGPHEFPKPPAAKVVQEKTRERKLCTKCKLHPKNPASQTNGCEHVYEEPT